MPGYQHARDLLYDRLEEIEERTEAALAAAGQVVPPNLMPFLEGDYGNVGCELAMPAVKEARREAMRTAIAGGFRERSAAVAEFCNTIERELAQEARGYLQQGPEAYEMLYATLDRLTPSYVKRIEQLSEQQQVVLMAFLDPSRSTDTLRKTMSEAAVSAHLPASSVSSALARLVAKDFLRKGEEEAGSATYAVRDPIYHAFLIMRCVRPRHQERMWNILRQDMLRNDTAA